MTRLFRVLQEEIALKTNFEHKKEPTKQTGKLFIIINFPK